MENTAIPTDGTQGLDAQPTDTTAQVAETKPAPKTYDEAYVKQLREENAKHRTKLKEFEDAQLTESQKLAQRIEEADKRNTALADRVIKSEVKLVAQSQNLVDPEAVYALLDKSRIERDEQGEPTNIADLVAELAKSKPYLVSQTPAAPPSGGMIANPARPRGEGNTFTREQIADREFYEANRDAIMAAFRAGRIE